MEPIGLDRQELERRDALRGRPQATRLVPAAGEDEADRLAPVGGQAGRLHHLVQALLGAHVARVEDDLAILRPAEAAGGPPPGPCSAPRGGPSCGTRRIRSGRTPSEARYGVKPSETTPTARAPAATQPSAAEVDPGDRAAAGDPRLARRRTHEVLEEESIRGARSAAR